MKTSQELQKNPFQLLSLPQENALLMTRKAALSLSDPSIIRLLQRLQGDTKMIYSREEIDRLFTEFEVAPAEGLEFLSEETQILSPYVKPQDAIRRVGILTDSEELFRLAVDSLNGCGLDVVRHEPGTPTDLVFTYLENYESQKIKSAMEASIPKTFFLTSYLLGTELLVDNLHHAEWLSPCHFCNIENLKMRAAQQSGSSLSSFFYFHEYLMRNRLPFSPSLVPDTRQKLLIHYTLLTRLRDLLGLDGPVSARRYDPRLSLTLDLESGASSSDLALHWDYCSCLETSL